MEEIQWYYIHGKNERRCELLVNDLIEKYKTKNEMWDLPNEEVIYDIRNEYQRSRRLKYRNQPILIFKKLEEMKSNSIEVEIKSLVKTGVPEIILLSSYHSPEYYKWTHELMMKYPMKIINVDESLLIVN